MAVAHGPLLVAVLLLLVSSGLHCSSPPSACPESCTCQSAHLLNCSSSGLSFVPQHIQDSVTELDLSHNLLDSVTLHRPHRNLRNVWLGNNTITRLSLCIARKLADRTVRSKYQHHSRRRCVYWAPNLQLLSVERNQLVQLPEGLEGSASLLVLELSYNRISTLRQDDLSHLQQLKELYLQHNLITSLHPQTFQDLAQLRVLDLSYNKLSSIHSLTYLSLRNIGADVRLDGNRWLCDCSMRSLRRRMAYDSTRGLQAWNMVCAFPTMLSGKDLLQLEEDELNCFGTEDRPELYQDVTVYSGSEMLLSCSAQDSLWWTPGGQASVSPPRAGLFISDITEGDSGLYMCLSQEHEMVSVFNLQITRVGHAKRKTRSLPRTRRQVEPQGNPDRIGQERNQRAAQCNLALAVCLSVFITFLVAFIVGVLARPYIDVLWSKVSKKKRPTSTNPVTSAGQQYDNEAYSNTDEPEEIVTHRERRVTFSDERFSEENNVEYYNTVANSNHESINNVNECDDVEDVFTAGDSGSENSLRQSSPDNQKEGRHYSEVTDAKYTQETEYEHIPDPVEMEDKRRLSSSSDSSLSDGSLKEDPRTQVDERALKTVPLEMDYVQQRADWKEVEVPQISKESRSEPFTDWSPHANHNQPDSELDNEEQFDFSDQSSSPKSSRVFGFSKQTPASKTYDSNDMSSSSSYVSENEPTEYTVNSEQEEEHTEKSHIRTVTDDRDTLEKIKPQTKWRGLSLGVTSFPKGLDSTAPSPRATYSSSSCSDDEVETANLKLKYNKGRKHINIKAPLSDCVPSSSSDSEDDITYHTVRPGKAETTKLQLQKSPTLSYDLQSSWPVQDLEASSHDLHASWPVLDLEDIPTLNRHLDIKAPSVKSVASASSDSEDDTTYHTVRPEKVETAKLPLLKSPTLSHDLHASWPVLNLEDIPTPKRRLDIKATSVKSVSSSSSDSEDEITYHTVRPEKVETAKLPLLKSPTLSHDLHASWPVLNLEDIPTPKRRLDIKATSVKSVSSSSSDGEDEITYHTVRPEKVETAKLPLLKSPTLSHDLHASWPVLNLEDIPTPKRRLDIKATSVKSVSSSSSDSEDEITYHTVRPEKVETAKLPLLKSPTLSHDLHASWPVLNLEDIPTPKRRLDIKATSVKSVSSSSSDSEDEITYHTVRPEKVETAKLPLLKSPTLSHDLHASWPVLNLEDIPTLKRRLDFKATSVKSVASASSDSEDEITYRTVRPEKVEISNLPLQKFPSLSHDLHASWPALHLENIPTLKRRLDIKATSVKSVSYSSSDSEDEITYHTVRPEKVKISNLPLQKFPSLSHDLHANWPVLNLEDIPTLKRRLDIKATSVKSVSSSSSDSEDEITYHTVRPGHVETAQLPLQQSQTSSHDLHASWPALHLENISHLKRRLDIKAPSTGFVPSARSYTEDEITYHTIRPGKVETAKLLLQQSRTSSHDLHASWPALHLENIPMLKRRLDIKAPSVKSLSSSNSDREDEITYHTVRPGHVETAKLPLQRSQTSSHDLHASWPALHLENIPHLKRRLDIKAPSTGFVPSASSHTEDEITYHTIRPGKVETAKLLLQQSRTSSHDLHASWPALHLENIPRLKRRLDIKAPSTGSVPSASSYTEDEITYHTIRPGKVETAKLPLQKLPSSSHDLHASWPALHTENIPILKRRLDIKAPSVKSLSSTSSDREDEITYHTVRPGHVETAKLLLQQSQTSSHDLHASWPVLYLEDIPRIKRRLDITAPSVKSVSASSSDRVDDTTHHTVRPGYVETAKLPMQKSSSSGHDLHASWPALHFENIPRIKRRLDIKAPSVKSVSSSSSDREDQLTYHTVRPGKLESAKHPLQMSPTSSHDLYASWPALHLENIPRLKRRLDIKAPSTGSVPYSSSDSEDEITYANLPLQKSPTSSHDLHASSPALHLENIPTLKRHLDIKAPSVKSVSSSSSDREDELMYHTVRPGKLESAKHPLQMSPSSSHDLYASWPALHLENIPTLKRRLDIKAPSTGSLPYSSSNSEDEMTYHTIRPGHVETAKLPLQTFPTLGHDLHASSPALHLENIPTLRRRLDIKAPSVKSVSSSSSDREDEITYHTVRPGKLESAKHPLQMSPSSSHDLHARWPALHLENITRLKRRLDIKAPSTGSVPSASGYTEDEITYHTARPGKVETAKLPLQMSPTSSDALHASWPVLHLENIPRIKRRLDIKAPPLPPHYSSNKQKPKKVNMSELLLSESQKASHHGSDTEWPAYIPHIKQHLAIKAQSLSTESYSSSDSDDETTNHIKRQERWDVHMSRHPNEASQTRSHDPETEWPALDLVHTTNIKSPQQPDSSLNSNSVDFLQYGTNSSRSGSGKSNNNAEANLEPFDTSKVLNKDFIRSPKTTVINISPNQQTDHNVKLEKYSVITDDRGVKPTNDNTNMTPEINPELESRWATMNLGFSRFRKRLDITSRSHVPPNISTWPSPDSVFSPNREIEAGNSSSRARLRRRNNGGQEIISTDSSPTLENKPVNVSPTMMGLDNKGLNLKVGVPRITRRLNIKALSPERNDALSSSSENENEEMTDSYSQIMYKRSIMKPSLHLSNSFSASGKSQTQDHTEMLPIAQGLSHSVGNINSPTESWSSPSMSFDLVKKRTELSRDATDGDQPSEIRWTGIGRHFSDLSTSSHGRHTDVGLPSPRWASPPTLEPNESNSSICINDEKLTDDNGKAEETVIHKNTYPISTRFTSDRALEKVDITGGRTGGFKDESEDRKKKGLNALKAISSERLTWDTEDEDLGAI